MVRSAFAALCAANARLEPSGTLPVAILRDARFATLRRAPQDEGRTSRVQQSARKRLVEIGDDDFAHLHHCLHGTIGFCTVGIAEATACCAPTTTVAGEGGGGAGAQAMNARLLSTAAVATNRVTRGAMRTAKAHTRTFAVIVQDRSL